MKLIFKLIGVLLALAPFSIPFLSMAQAPSALGGFSFINSTNLPGVVMLKVDGIPYKPAGYLSGSFTSGGQLTVGSHPISLEGEGAKPITQNIPIAESDSILCIGYTVVKPKADGTTETELQLLQLPDKPKKPGFRFTALYISEQPSCTLYINKEPVTLTSMKAVSLDAKQALRVSLTPPTGSDIETRQTKDNLKFTPDVPGDYLLVVFDGPEKKLKFRLVDNTKG